MARFGAWLLRQGSRTGWIGELAKDASLDRGFPRDADPDAVRTYLERRGCMSGDIAECLEDAERVWSREVGASSEGLAACPA